MEDEYNYFVQFCKIIAILREAREAAQHFFPSNRRKHLLTRFCLLLHQLNWKPWRQHLLRFEVVNIFIENLSKNTFVKSNSSMVFWFSSLWLILLVCHWLFVKSKVSPLKYFQTKMPKCCKSFRFAFDWNFMHFVIFFQGQFDSVFLPFIHQRPKFQANCQLWTAYKPNVSSSTGATLPRLCKKCTKKGTNHVGLDPFPQKSSTALVWYRINLQDFQGEVRLHPHFVVIFFQWTLAEIKYFLFS